MSKDTPKKLTELSKEKQIEFFDSFDIILCDVDGVLWELGKQEIEGAPEGIAALRKLGKKCYFVTNGSSIPLELMTQQRLKKYNAVEEELVRPSTALRWYLEKINFNKEVYIVGFQSLKDEFKKAGFKVITDETTPMPETAEGIFAAISNISSDVGAVIIDHAVNVNFLQIQKCAEYIMKNKALFLVGGWEPAIPFRGTKMIGPLYYVKGVQEVTGAEPIVLSKPSKDFNDVILEKVKPADPNRILFIGDSAITDMAFATKFGYQKLVPLTGSLTIEDLRDWKHDEKWKPDYYVDSLMDVDTIIKNLDLNNT